MKLQVDPIHERAAELLGWTVAECRSFNLRMLREIVRDKDRKLADDISAVLDGEHHVLERVRKPRLR